MVAVQATNALKSDPLTLLWYFMQSRGASCSHIIFMKVMVHIPRPFDHSFHAELTIHSTII